MYISENKTLQEIQFKTCTVKRGKYKDKLLCDTSIGFDIETSSGFMRDGKIIKFDKRRSPSYWEDFEKVGIMYIWQCAIENNVFYGRTTNDLLDFIEELEEVCPAYKFIYIHNQAFEFQAILREIFTIESVFARDVRHPMSTVLADYNIEFRCSYFLTNLSLARCCDEYNLKTKKLVGDLDYIPIRTPLTKLNKTKELPYCFNDVLILTEMIEKFRQEYKHIYNIPLTQTGEVRRDLRRILTKKPKWLRLCKALNDVDFDQYVEWCRMFTGGTVHANRLFANQVIRAPIWCYDFGSDYPFQMITQRYPLSRFVSTKYNIKYEDSYKYSYLIHIGVTNLESVKFNEYMSKSKAIVLKNCIDDNGKILSADYAEFNLTNIDYNIFKQCYKGDIDILDFKYAVNDYLPDEICKFVIDLYKAKSTLKGQKGVEDLYMKKKQKLNSCFGMAVTKIISDTINYNGDWSTTPLDEKLYYEKLEEENNKSLSSHILPFQIGLWIPAYARKMLWDHFIIPCDDLLLYYDTDSIYTHSQEVLKYVEKHNKWAEKQRQEVAKRLNVPLEDLQPTDVKGNIHKIGDMELDGEYTEGIFLGAKRYCLRSAKDGELHQTVAGVRKGSVKVLKNEIENFKHGLVYDYDNSQKIIMTYIDNQQSGLVWNKGKYDEWTSYNKYGVNAMPTTFTIELADNYLKLLQTSRKDDVLQNVTKIL